MSNYLYNGVELPDINTVWTDKTTYPYAVLFRYVSGAYCLKIATQPITVGLEGNAVNPQYTCRNGETWSENSTVTLLGSIFWANHDVYYSDSLEEVGGTLYLAASDPIPVNPAPTLDPTALLMGWQVGNRIRGGA